MDTIDCQPEELPPYRRLHGTLKAFNPFRGWVPAGFNNSKFESVITQTPIFQGIGSIEKSLKSEDPNLTFPLSANMRVELAKLFNSEFYFELIVNPAGLHSLVDSAKNLVLNWSLKLEEEGVKDDVTRFTFEDQAAATKATMTVINGNIGSVGAISENLKMSGHSRITASTEAESLDELTKGVLEIVHNLEESHRKRIESLLKEGLESKSIKTKRKNLTSVRNIAEGATGSAIWSLITSALSNL